jgi:hypothetical protein
MTEAEVLPRYSAMTHAAKALRCTLMVCGSKFLIISEDDWFVFDTLDEVEKFLHDLVLDPDD